MCDQLERLRALARVEVAPEIARRRRWSATPELTAWLRSLSTEQLLAVERLCELLEFGPPAALKPAERLTT